MLKNNCSSSSKSVGKQQEDWEVSMIEILELNPWEFFSKPSLAYSTVHC